MLKPGEKAGWVGKIMNGQVDVAIWAILEASSGFGKGRSGRR
jgi:hypothetical protein